MRKVAIGAFVVALLMAFLAMILPRLISLEALKPRIVAAMEEKTGRKVALSGISLSLFPGIGAKVANLVVSGDPGHPGENLISVPEAEIRLALAPLLSGRAEFTRFILRRPDVLFRKYRDGTHSATEMAGRLSREEKPSAATPKERVSIVLKGVSIEDATLTLFVEGEDGRETRWKLSPFSFHLSGIGRGQSDFELRTRIEGVVRGEISFAGTSVYEEKASSASGLRVAGKGKIFGQEMSVEGKMPAPGTLAEMDFTVDFPRIKAADLPGILERPPAFLTRISPEGIASLAIKVSGTLPALGVEAKADLTRAGFSIGPEIHKVIDMPCTLVVQGQRFADRLLLSKAELKLPSLLMNANASFIPSTGEREWTVSARISSLAEWGKAPAGALSRWAPAGTITASGKGRRASATAKETWGGEADLSGVGFRIPDRGLELRALNGHLEVHPKSVDFLPLAGLLNGQGFSLRGTMALGPHPEGEADLRMAYLDVDALFPPKEGTAPGKKGELSAPPDTAGSRQPVSARVRLSIEAGKARGVEFRDMTGLIRYEDGSLLLDAVRAKVFGGEAAVSGRVGLAGVHPDFRVKVTMKNIEAGEILSRKTSLKDFLSGPVSLTSDIGGGVKDFSEFTRTASGAGSLRMAGGKIKGVDLLAAAAGVSGLRSLLPAAPSVPGGGKVAETAFSDLSADFRIEGGKIRSDALKVVSDKMGLDGKAALGFDRTFDFRGTLKLSRQMSERARGMSGQFLAGPSGQVEIPLVMSGPVTSPTMAIDTESLARGLAGKAVRSLTEQIPGLPLPAGKLPAAPQGREKAQGGDEPRKALEGLFEKMLPGKK